MTHRLMILGVALASVTLAACDGAATRGSGSGGVQEPGGSTAPAGAFTPRKLAFDSSHPENPSVGFFTTDDGQLGIRVGGMEIGGLVHSAVIDNVTVASGDTTAAAPTIRTMSFAPAATTDSDPVPVSCSVLETGKSGRGDAFDIAVSLDTTGSMGGAAGVFAQRIADFAAGLEAEGLDVRFAGITLGDAFATRRDEGATDYTDDVSLGSLGTPPTFDTNERPDTGLDLVGPAEMQRFFEEVSRVAGSGQGGGDSPENYLGAIDFLNQNVSFREDAGRFFIAIGDNCAHTSASLPGGSDNAPWRPRAAEDIEASFASQGAAVHLIWSTRNCGSSYYDMQTLRAATGGASTPLPSSCSTAANCDIDLTMLPAFQAVTTERATFACAIPATGALITVSFNLTMGGVSWFVQSVLEVDSL